MRILGGIFIALFMAMLTIPLVFVDLASDRVSVQENRMLAQRPVLADIKTHPGSFVREFDTWFKDSTGFREQLIGVYNVMGKSRWLNGIHRYMDGEIVYLIGESGHIFCAGGESSSYMLEKFQGKQFLTDDQLANMAAKLEEAKTYLDKQGIPLIVMLCTDKESIYPEFYPKSIKRGPEPIQLDVITGYLQEHTGVDVFNIRQALLAEKNNFLLYLITDTFSFSSDFLHYNEIGAFFAYRELMRHINVYVPEIIPYELDDVDINYNEKGIPTVSLKQKKVYRQLDASFFDDVNVVRPFVFSWDNQAYENTESDLPVILFFRDSYTVEQYIGKYFAQHFGKAIFIHYRNMEHIDEYVDKYRPDIVIFESAERELRGFADCVAGIPKLP
jgi:hypothetical protein